MISRRLNEKAPGPKPKEIHTKLVGHKLTLELNQEGLVEQLKVPFGTGRKGFPWEIYFA